MPTSVVAAAIAGFAGGITFSAAAGLGFAGFAWGHFATSLVISAASRALQKKPKLADLSSTAGSRAVTFRQPVAPWRVIYGQARVGGTIVFAHTITNGDTSGLYMVIVLASHEVEEIGDIYFDDYKLVLNANGHETSRYVNQNGPLVGIKKFLGTADQAADETFITNTGGKWTSAHRLRGRAGLYVTLVASGDKFPTGIPNITAVVKGRKIYDPRTGTRAWSANAALCQADYLADAKIGLGAAYGTEIDQLDLTAAANVCDEQVALAGGGYEARYTCNGTFDTDQKPAAILAQLLTASSGKAVYLGGRWRLLAGAYQSPAVTLTEADARGAIKIQSRMGKRAGCNAVKGVYISPTNAWQASDFPPVTNSTYLSEDAGERVWKDIDLPFTTSPATAQRMAKIELERARQQITVAMPCKLSAYRVQPGDTVLVNNTRMGWSGKPFEVVSATLAFDTDGTVGVDLGLRETAAAVFDWGIGNETTVDPAPDTDLPDPFTVPAPGAVVVTEELYQTSASGGVKTRAIVTWMGAGGFVSDYALEWQETGASEWRSIAPISGTRAEIDDIAPGLYDFRLRARSTLGIYSAYGPTTHIEVLGLGAVPAAVTGLSLVPLGSMAMLSWDRHADLDVRIGGSIDVRHSGKTSGAVWEDGVPVQSFSGASTFGSIPLLAGTYLVKAVDSGGLYSTSAAAVVTTAPNVLTFNAAATSTQHPTFGGTKTNLEVASSKLRLGALPNIDSVTDLIDAWADVDAAGRTDAYAGNYLFDEPVDLGAVYMSRVTAAITAIAVDNSDLIDGRAALIDTWASFDGGIVNDATVELFFRTTNDDPAGSPAWSAWKPFLVGDYTARGYDFRLDFAVQDLQHNVEVSALSVNVDMPDRVESGSVTTGTGADTTVSYAKAFKASPKVGLTIANMAASDVVEIVSEGASSFSFNIRNGGARVARNVNWIVKGY